MARVPEHRRGQGYETERKRIIVSQIVCRIPTLPLEPFFFQPKRKYFSQRGNTIVPEAIRFADQ